MQMLQIFNQLAWLVHVVILDGVLKKSNSRRLLNNNRAFSLTWPASMLIYWNKRKYLDEKRVQLPENFLGTPTWQPFHMFWNTNMAAGTSCENALFWRHFFLN